MQTGYGQRRRFAITVDGVRHEVIVEELPATELLQGAPAAAAPAPGSSGSAPDAPAPAGAAAPAGGLDDGWVPAPMPGTVTEVRVQAGDAVQAGDVLLVLTAMKMENEITAPAAGIVKAVGVTEGATVNSGDRLVHIAPEEG
ncbi:MAG TPA: biotin/lipoyl-containing protein [Limnochordales bacterium]|nr:biotin/lipoyl-containing protein [Limnochordales bacterium]